MTISRGSHDIPERWLDLLHSAARQAAGDGCSAGAVDRIADAAAASLLGAVQMAEQIRELPLVDPMPPHATMERFETQRRVIVQRSRAGRRQWHRGSTRPLRPALVSGRARIPPAEIEGL